MSTDEKPTSDTGSGKPLGTKSTAQIQAEAKAQSEKHAYGSTHTKDTNSEGEDSAEFIKLQRKNASARETARLNAQCFLMESMGDLRQYAENSFKSLTSMKGSTETLKEKLLAKSGLASFLNLRPFQIAAMVPYVDIYLVQGSRSAMMKAGSTAKGRTTPVLFTGFYKQENIQALMAGSSLSGGRGTAVGLKEFYYEGDGGAPGGKEVKSTRKATLKFVGESLSALDHREPGYATVLDLAMVPLDTLELDGADAMPNPQSYLVRIVWGWSVPLAMQKHFNTFQLESISRGAESMLLFNSDVPKITMTEDGGTELELTYISKIELQHSNSPDNRNINVFEDSTTAGNKVTNPGPYTGDSKAKTHLNTLLRDVKKTLTPEGIKELAGSGDFNADNAILVNSLTSKKNGYHSFQTKNDSVDLEGYGGNEYLKNVDEDPGHKLFSDDKSFEKFSAKVKTAGDAVNALRTQEDREQLGGRVARWSVFLNSMLSEKKIHSIMVKKEELGFFVNYDGSNDYAIGKRKRPRILSAEELAKLSESERKSYNNALAAYRSGAIIDAEDHEGAKVTEVSNKLQKTGTAAVDAAQRGSATFNHSTDQSADSTSQYGGVVKATVEGISAQETMKQRESRDSAEQSLKERVFGNAVDHTTGYLQLDNTGLYVKLQYFYLGDLIDQVLFNSDFKESSTATRLPDKPMFILGALEYPDMAQTIRRTIPLAEVPISLELFKAWMIKNVVSKLRDRISLKEFIDEILKDLVIPALGGGPQGCISGPAGQMNGSGLTYQGFEAPGQTGNNKCRLAIHRPKTGHLDPTVVEPLQAESLGTRENMGERVDHRYIVVTASTRTTSNLNGKKEQDQKAGIYWLGMGHDGGPVLSTTFERIDDEAFKSVYAGSNRETFARRGLDGSIVVPQTVEIKMIGNNLFGLGSTFFSDIENVGSSRDYAIASALGFGGYYTCINYHSTVNENGWEKTVSGYPKAGTGTQASREKWLENRGKIFGETPEQQNQREAQEAAAVAHKEGILTAAAQKQKAVKAAAAAKKVKGSIKVK